MRHNDSGWAQDARSVAAFRSALDALGGIGSKMSAAGSSRAQRPEPTSGRRRRQSPSGVQARDRAAPPSRSSEARIRGTDTPNVPRPGPRASGGRR